MYQITRTSIAILDPSFQSEIAYGATSYIRNVDVERRVSCTLLMTGPIRTVTIPRLELSAPALSVKLDKTLRKELDKELEDSVCWTDIIIVIDYTKDDDRRFETFVTNHPSVIHDGSKPAQWRHVGSALNPAHDLSRGLIAEEL